MGGCCSVSLSCDQVLNQVTQWLCVKESYIHNLEENLTALETAMEELKGRRDDLSRKVEREEMKGLRRLAQVQVWLTRVETIESQVNDLFSAKTTELQRLCFCGFCSKSFKLSYRYGKRVFMMLKEIESLKSNGIFEVVAEQPQASKVVERPIQPTIVGPETILETAWNRLMEDGVGIIGLYGMGGVGKTTLLTQINNKFLKKEDAFDIVIWVVVSKDFQIQKIQEDIAKKLGLAGDEWNRKDEDQKACDILNVLKRKKFVLFLDDIWEKVDLSKIGVPFPSKENKCKVVFTTRSKEVCGGMGVDVEMEVKCLPPQDALDLFRKKVGKITLRSHPNIPELANVVAKKCHGLPLALNVIGETMARKRTIQEWRHAVDVLTSYAAEFSRMEDAILRLLKYSYDNIKEEHVKSCLLYCALFPEDYRIPKERLIEYLIGEGIIDGNDGIERAENKGYEIIGSLVRASLLMEGGEELDRTEYVCMHDVVREMALWIASELGKQKEAFIVRAGVGLDKMPKVKNWNVVRRMSLMNNKIDHLVGEPECLELTTLLMQKNSLKRISSEFFKSMPKLVVLDLSDNDNLCVLPEEISELGSLQYLNLKNTYIRHLPMGLQELKELIHLDLEGTTKLKSIAGISSLHSLRVLKLSFSSFTWDHFMEELETLEHLQVLTIGIIVPFALEKFLRSHRLSSCTRSLMIHNINMDTSGIVLPETMDKLCHLITGDSSISEIKMVSPLHSLNNLSTVDIENCEGLKELTLLMFAVNLKDLSVYRVNQLEDIINKEKACESEESGIVPFPNLISLKLSHLRKLKNIYWSPLPLPCLKVIQVIGCPNLKKLPLNSQSGEKGLVIKYRGKKWIKGVEWEDEATKTRFLSSCQQVQKRGSVGRSIDVTRYSGYDELRHDLARMFGIEGKLEDPQTSDWKLVYTDHENDILLVGDDPWGEFVNCVQNINILSSEEVQQMSLDIIDIRMTMRPYPPYPPARLDH